MTQNQLDRQVAQATGETVDFIRSRGFSVLNMPNVLPPRHGDVQATATQPKRVRSANQPRHKVA